MSTRATVPIGQPSLAGPRWATAVTLLRGKPSPDRIRAAGFADLDEVARTVADHFKLPRIDLDAIELAAPLAALVPRPQAERHGVVAVFDSGDEVTLATSDPARLEVFDWVAREARRQIVLVVASAAEIERAIKRLYDLRVVPAPVVEVVDGDDHVSAEELEQATGIVDRLIDRAVEQRASDIHLEATDGETCVRYRVDGMLRVVETRPGTLHAAIVSRIKVLARLDISIKQTPQDGRIKLRRQGGDVDLRVSTLPTYFGEKVVCRILDNGRARLSLADLGLEGDQAADFERMIRAPYGLVLVTGPTGSGKSTTLYAALNTVRAPELNIVSVEDPVEYQLPGINQVQVNEKRGLTFAGALRSILRQDPNVILVGEIRDRETAMISAEAALTGHLVLSSLHTNDAAGAIVRLAEMGVEPHLLAPSLLGIVAQRLIRTVCAACVTTYRPDDAEVAALELPALPAGVSFARGRGCRACGGTGYAGRAAIRELLDVTDPLKAAIGARATADELRAVALREGFRPMRFQALRQLLAGVTTVAEVLRVTKR